ncbi:uncharacterized protein TNIN_197181 [Trichonephila inaurata madagascariensis]|uniref:Mutator-like transposase domain-containing protein n=1 Tax=Trichonephila inaurata madagascariensis TaxID=2747483 RepID=A0A8X6YLN6_9ARAC|nr:uncharacterized protein TNIN_197181 [Trichonephila inaurata madagascariensis]
MKVCPHTNVAERRDTGEYASSNKISGIQTSLKSNLVKEVTEESMERAAVEENSSSPDNLLTVSGDGTWKTRGHSSLIGVCTVIGAETGKVLNREVLSSFCKGCDSYKGVKKKVVLPTFSKIMEELLALSFAYGN